MTDTTRIPAHIAQIRELQTARAQSFAQTMANLEGHLRESHGMTHEQLLSINQGFNDTLDKFEALCEETGSIYFIGAAIGIIATIFANGVRDHGDPAFQRLLDFNAFLLELTCQLVDMPDLPDGDYAVSLQIGEPDNDDEPAPTRH